MIFLSAINPWGVQKIRLYIKYSRKRYIKWEVREWVVREWGIREWVIKKWDVIYDFEFLTRTYEIEMYETFPYK